MKLDLLPLAPPDEQRAWTLLPNSPIQHTLHNELVRKILGLRDELESADPALVPEIQQSLKAHRYLLGLIHRNDKLPTKHK